MPAALPEDPSATRGASSVGAPASIHSIGATTAVVRATRAEFLADRQALALTLVADLLDESTLQYMLDAFAGALQRRFHCERAAVALASPTGELKLSAVSGQVRVDRSSPESRLLLDALGESVEQEKLLRHAADDGQELTAHRALAGRRSDTTILSVPLFHDSTLVGAFLLERREADAYSAAPSRDMIRQLALLAAPVIALQYRAEQGLLSRCRAGWRAILERRLGKDRPGLRLVSGLGLVLGIVAATVPLPAHIAADAELVPSERRLVTAPVDGFVEEVAVMAGEEVVEGQLLARLDRRELDLEASRRDSEIAMAEAEFRASMASHDRKETAIARARLARERALRDLVEQRRQRSELRVPIAGVVVSGDLPDATGAPVNRGDTLFEIAPATGYEVHLLVNEEDIRDVSEQQAGRLSLLASPGVDLALRVQSIHPVAESRDGASRFRVRAELIDPTRDASVTLRPGERGVVRLEAADRSLLAQAWQPVGRRLARLWWRAFG